jgi:ComF family protein
MSNHVSLKNRLLDLLYPTKCVLCRRLITPPGKPRICPDCWDELSRPPAGADTKGDFFSRCVSAVYYEGAMVDAIHRFKFNGNTAYASAFGELLASCIYEQLDEEYDLMTWVPVSRDRYRKRGYDQSQLLAQEAARRLGRELTPVLKKKRGVTAQSRQTDKESRKVNIAGAFRVLDKAAVEGQRILLIDDIVTTGSTLSECAKCLLMAGADKVVCATLADAGRP